MLRLYTLMVHNTSHSHEDIIINHDVFHDFAPGELIQIFDPERSRDKLILKVPPIQSNVGRLEISLSKLVAEPLNLKPFSKVFVEKVLDQEQVSVSFVELAFKKQYLQRGNMWRFKKAIFGKPVYLGQNFSVNGMQASIQELRIGETMVPSGIITERSKVVFRSRSSRIIWLVQISAEMWEYDQNGNLYFEKFLSDFVSPVFDSWKVLGVSHMLTVIFFCRTLYLERINAMTHPDIIKKQSMDQTTDGIQFQDFFKIVIENAADIDKVGQIKKLRQEFWTFPQLMGWKIQPQTPAPTGISKYHTSNTSNNINGNHNGGVDNTKSNIWNVDSDNDDIDSNDIDSYSNIHSENQSMIDGHNNNSSTREKNHSSASNSNSHHHTNKLNTSQLNATTSAIQNVNYAVPSDAVHGNFLESINTTLNILDKHYMDRDLQRTGNVIVMISAGSGVFKVKPTLAQITKQRMLDGGIGVDFIALSRPPAHATPLFLVDCRGDGIKDFYEMPHWLRVSYIDCKKEIKNSLDSSLEEQQERSGGHESLDALWAKSFNPQPLSSLLTAQLMHNNDLKSLATNYASNLPKPLKILMHANHSHASDDMRHAANNLLLAGMIQQTPTPDIGCASHNNNSVSNNANITPTVSTAHSSSNINVLKLKNSASTDYDESLIRKSPIIETQPSLNLPLSTNTSIAAHNTSTNKVPKLQAPVFILKPLTLDDHNYEHNGEIPTWGKVPPVTPLFSKLNTGDKKHQQQQQQQNLSLLSQIENNLPILKRERGDSSMAGSFGSVYGDDEYNIGGGGGGGNNNSSVSYHNQSMNAVMHGLNKNSSNSGKQDSTKDKNNKTGDSALNNSSNNYKNIPIINTKQIDSSTQQQQGGQASMNDNSGDNGPSNNLLSVSIEAASSHNISNSYFSHSIATEETPSQPNLSRQNSAQYGNINFKDTVELRKKLLQDIANNDDTFWNDKDKVLELMTIYDNNVFRSKPMTKTIMNKNETVVPVESIDNLFASVSSTLNDQNQVDNNDYNNNNNNNDNDYNTSPSPVPIEENREDDFVVRPLSMKEKRISFDERIVSTELNIYGNNDTVTNNNAYNSDYYGRGSMNLDNSSSHSTIGKDMNNNNNSASSTKPSLATPSALAQASMNRWGRGGGIGNYGGGQMDRRKMLAGQLNDVDKLHAANAAAASRSGTNVSPLKSSLSHKHQHHQSSVTTTSSTGGGQSLSKSKTSSQEDLATTSATTNSTDKKPAVVKYTSKNFSAAGKFVPPSRAATAAAAALVDKSNKGNFEFVILHGKITPVLADQQAAKKKAALENIREYCSKNCINPFRQKEGESYLKSITHNRRRWSHVYPSGVLEFIVDYGLTWKSLTQPAILPLNTDYLPSVNELKKGYDVQNFYQLLPDKYEWNFIKPEDLLRELVCQRLSQEFQLIEGVDTKPYLQFIHHQYATNRNSGYVVNSVLRRNNTGDELSSSTHGIASNSNIGVATLTSSLSVTSTSTITTSQQLQQQQQHFNNNFFILSMGHRIQFLEYDPSSDQINVTQYRSKKGMNTEDDKNIYTYKYELWVPQTNQYQTMTQTFYQFPNPEFKWNKVDNIICGNLPFDAIDDGTKPKRLRYAIIPEILTTDTELDEYYSKIDQLFEFLTGTKYCEKGTVKSIVKNRSLMQQEDIDSYVSPIVLKTSVSVKEKEFIPPMLGSISRGESASTINFNMPLSTKNSTLASRQISSNNNSNSSNSNNASTNQLVSPAPPSLPGSAVKVKPSDISNNTTTTDSHTNTTTNNSGNYSVNAKLIIAPAQTLYAKTKREVEVLKMNMRVGTATGTKHENPNWMYLKYDHHLYSYKTFHLEFHWFVCDSWLIDEFIAILYRKCKTWGIRLCQTPEYFSTPNLNVHPYRAQPYIQVPYLEVPLIHSSPVRLIERLYFRRASGWLFDNEQKTDWASLGLTVPNYTERDRDLLQNTANSNSTGVSGAGLVTGTLLSKDKDVTAASQPRILSTLSTKITSLLTPSLSSNNTSPHPPSVTSTTGSEKHDKHDKQTLTATSSSSLVGNNSNNSNSKEQSTTKVWKVKTDHNYDRQYIHHMGLATVRVATQGFIWLQNASSKVSDISLNNDEKKDLVFKKMLELQRFCVHAVDCYDIVLDVIQLSLNICEKHEQEQQLAKELSGGTVVTGTTTTATTAANPIVTSSVTSNVTSPCPSSNVSANNSSANLGVHLHGNSNTSVHVNNENHVTHTNTTGSNVTGSNNSVSSDHNHQGVAAHHHTTHHNSSNSINSGNTNNNTSNTSEYILKLI